MQFELCQGCLGGKCAGLLPKLIDGELGAADLATESKLQPDDHGGIFGNDCLKAWVSQLETLNQTGGQVPEGEIISLAIPTLADGFS